MIEIKRIDKMRTDKLRVRERAIEDKDSVGCSNEKMKGDRELTPKHGDH